MRFAGEGPKVGQGPIMSNLMKGKVFGLSMPKKSTMAPHLHNVILAELPSKLIFSSVDAESERRDPQHKTRTT